MKFKIDQTTQKLRGGYYTPLPLAKFITQWVTEKKARTILEPSCGDGNFLDALMQDRPDIELCLGIERDPLEASKAEVRLNKGYGADSKCKIICADFLEWAMSSILEGKQFDAIIGNPPFIRYQFLDTLDQALSKALFDKYDLKFTKHTNAWVPFVIASIALLRAGGRLGMMIPSELLHVLHADSLRKFLLDECTNIVIFDPEDLWFENTLQGVVILLAEKKTSREQIGNGVAVIPTKGDEFLSIPASKYIAESIYIHPQKLGYKWTKALLKPQEYDLFEAMGLNKDVHLFDSIAHVAVGIVTGANEYFLISDEVVERYKLQEYVHPMFGKSTHCKGVIYNEERSLDNAKRGLPTNFLWIKRSDMENLNQETLEYIKYGEGRDFHKRYKCRIREPWVEVPSVYATEIGMLKRSHDTPRLIYNEISAYTTDTAYRITSEKYSPKQLVASFVNPLTALSAELEGRHYGGGVLELVPSEIRKLLLPTPKLLDYSAVLENLDGMIINKVDTLDILTRQGEIILGPLGLAATEQQVFIGAWQRLKSRRQRHS